MLASCGKCSMQFRNLPGGFRKFSLSGGIRKWCSVM